MAISLDPASALSQRESNIFSDTFNSFDFDLARKLVREEMERRPDLLEVVFGLEEDWDCGEEVVWDRRWDAELSEPSGQSRSIWATPAIMFVYQDGTESDKVPCFKETPRTFDEKGNLL